MGFKIKMKKKSKGFEAVEEKKLADWVWYNAARFWHQIHIT